MERGCLIAGEQSQYPLQLRIWKCLQQFECKSDKRVLQCYFISIVNSEIDRWCFETLTAYVKKNSSHRVCQRTSMFLTFRLGPYPEATIMRCSKGSSRWHKYGVVPIKNYHSNLNSALHIAAVFLRGLSCSFYIGSLRNLYRLFRQRRRIYSIISVLHISVDANLGVATSSNQRVMRI